MSRTARLQAKVQALEESVRLAEALQNSGPALAARRATKGRAWSNPILNGEQIIPRPRLDRQPFIVAYPVPSSYTIIGLDIQRSISEVSCRRVACGCLLAVLLCMREG